jgi:hypothetical protein
MMTANVGHPVVAAIIGVFSGKFSILPSKYMKNQFSQIPTAFLNT